MNESKLLTAKEVAEILQVSVMRVYELARLKALPSVRLLRQVRFDQKALQQFIEQGGCAQTGDTDDGFTEKAS